jgi:putative peptide maturation dehydrogenase
MPAKFRRSQYLLFTLEDLAGGVGRLAGSSWVVTSLVSGQHRLVSSKDLEMLRNLSSQDWAFEDALLAAGFDHGCIEEFTKLGILISDVESGLAQEFRIREARLIDNHWPPCAAAHHLLSHHQENLSYASGKEFDTNISERMADDRAARFLASHGPPPDEFFRHPGAQSSEKLPLISTSSEVTEAFLKRRTCRHFEPGSAIEIGQLSELLRLVFGPKLVRTLAGRVRLLLKTSPSGGSLHPIEAFPLILRCEGKSPGTYHYRCDLHALALLRELPEAVARRLAVLFAQGQAFVGTCSVVVVLAARFDRNFWKYQERENSYAVVHQDAGHLSQTFQVLATAMGLSCFYTAAIRSEAVVDALALKYPAESPIGLLGLGIGASQAEESVGVKAYAYDSRD